MGDGAAQGVEPKKNLMASVLSDWTDEDVGVASFALVSVDALTKLLAWQHVEAVMPQSDAAAATSDVESGAYRGTRKRARAHDSAEAEAQRSRMLSVESVPPGMLALLPRPARHGETQLAHGVMKLLTEFFNACDYVAKLAVARWRTHDRHSDPGLALPTVNSAVHLEQPAPLNDASRGALRDALAELDTTSIDACVRDAVRRWLRVCARILLPHAADLLTLIMDAQPSVDALREDAAATPPQYAESRSLALTLSSGLRAVFSLARASLRVCMYTAATAGMPFMGPPAQPTCDKFDAKKHVLVRVQGVELPADPTGTDVLCMSPCVHTCVRAHQSAYLRKHGGSEDFLVRTLVLPCRSVDDVSSTSEGAKTRTHTRASTRASTPVDDSLHALPRSHTHILAGPPICYTSAHVRACLDWLRLMLPRMPVPPPSLDVESVTEGHEAVRPAAAKDVTDAAGGTARASASDTATSPIFGTEAPPMVVPGVHLAASSAPTPAGTGPPRACVCEGVCGCGRGDASKEVVLQVNSRVDLVGELKSERVDAPVARRTRQRMLRR